MKKVHIPPLPSKKKKSSLMSFWYCVVDFDWVSYHYNNINMCSAPEISTRDRISTLLRDGNPSSCMAISLNTSVTIQVKPHTKPRGQSTISIIGQDLAPMLPFGVLIYVIPSCGDSHTCLNSQQLRLCSRIHATSHEDGRTNMLVYRCNCHPDCDSVFVHMKPQITHSSIQLCEIEM